MSLPILLGSAGCPTATVTAALLTGVPQLVGFMEFGSLSVPPVLYRKYSTNNGGWTYTRTWSAHPTETHVGAGINGVSSWQWDATTGALGGSGPDATQVAHNIGNATNGPTTVNLLLAENVPFLSTDGSTPSANGLDSTTMDDPLAYPGSSYGTEFPPSITINSKTQLTLTQTARSHTDSPVVNSVNAGSLVFTLSDPDTDADAIARASLSSASVGPDPVAAAFGDGIFSVWETRVSAGATAFNYQKGTYEIDCANLLAGLQYHYVVVWEERTAVTDGFLGTTAYGTTWANSDSASGDFTPSGSTYAITGLTIPLAQGYQKRIKSITITPIGP